MTGSDAHSAETGYRGLLLNPDPRLCLDIVFPADRTTGSKLSWSQPRPERATSPEARSLAIGHFPGRIHQHTKSVLAPAAALMEAGSALANAPEANLIQADNTEPLDDKQREETGRAVARLGLAMAVMGFSFRTDRWHADFTNSAASGEVGPYPLASAWIIGQDPGSLEFIHVLRGPLPASFPVEGGSGFQRVTHHLGIRTAYDEERSQATISLATGTGVHDLDALTLETAVQSRLEQSAAGLDSLAQFAVPILRMHGLLGDA